tara:strand:+ start:1310 stop:1492 length:183 start_codon:yes stop_codon:yes gene_type:complete
LTLVELFSAKLSEEIESRSDDVSNGTVKDFNEYRHRIGIIEGLKMARRDFREILKNYENA